MRYEYLIFDLVIGGPPLLLALWSRSGFRPRLLASLVIITLVAIPFVAWDAAVTGRHWWFNRDYTLGFELFGLPFEEILFFFVVPFACLFLWETVLVGRRARMSLPAWVHGVAASLIPIGFAVALLGPGYTGLAVLAFGVVAMLDHGLGTAVLRQPRFWAFVVVVSALNLVFNGYLTGRPVVLYSDAAILGVRVGTIPLEDFVYGAALLTGVVVGFQWFEQRRPERSWLARLIEHRLGGYRHVLVAGDSAAEQRLGERRTVGIVGGGLAGLSAATVLAERGFTVTVFERNPYLGGKLAAFDIDLADGSRTRIEHGFHAFFRHYYNLGRFLERLGVADNLRSIERYQILTRDGEPIVFGDERRAPVLNLLGLARTGLYDFREVAFGPAGRELEAFLRYDPEQTFAAFDELPFSEFARRARLPARLLTVFTTFSRAFFADAEFMSTAELIKSFHFYYLGHDLGLVYDYFDGGIGSGLLEPLEQHLRDHGVDIRCGVGVEALERDGDGRLTLDGRGFDEVVLASDVAATSRLLAGSSTLAEEVPELTALARQLRAGQPYAVLRIWIDRRAPTHTPVFVSTERITWLDAIAFVDRIEPAAARWAERHGGGVLELHCYALPDDASPAQVRKTLMAELVEFVPELRGFELQDGHLQLRRDFTAYHAGMSATRPGHATELDDLHLCGDWVRLPCPAMLMEAAHTSALLVANAILRKHGLREELVETVPPRGVLVGVPGGQRAVTRDHGK